MTTRRALLLDLDGTIADSLQVMRRAYEALLEENGRVPSEAEFRLLNGPRLVECAALLRQSHDLKADVDAILVRWLALIEAAYEDVKPAQGALELILAARAAGWGVAIVTSGPGSLAARWLVRVGFFDLVDTVVGGEAVAKGKPDPAPYAEAMKRLNMTPARCIAVEDTQAGAASALAAGARTFALETGGLALPRGAERISRLTDVIPQLTRSQPDCC